MKNGADYLHRNFHSPMNQEQKSTSAYVAPAQLCIGMYVYVELPWTEHPFTFSSFKITSQDQITTLQSLGLDAIRYNPTKSDAAPLNALAASVAKSVVPGPVPQAHINQAKRARIERLLSQQTRAATCAKEFESTAKTVKSINNHALSNPEQARKEAESLVQAMADSMLTDSDIAINLMNDHIGGEDVYFHSLNVTLLAMMLAKEMKAPGEAIRQMGMGSMFHDIGKANLPELILRKTDLLSRAELTLLKLHCAYGVEIGRKMGLSSAALKVILQHHEHVDGSGYPKGIQGSEINLLARIVAIVNSFDNLCNPVKQSLAVTPHQALSLMYAHQSGRFDKAALAAFVRCMGVYPAGTVVSLSNDCVGMVVSVNSAKPLKPTVLIYDPQVPREQAILVELASDLDVTISRALPPDQLPKPIHEYLSPGRNVTYYFDTESKGANA